MADEDWDDKDELLMVTGRGSKAAGKKRQRKADSEDDEDERPQQQRKAGAKAGRGRAAADSDSEEDSMDEGERAKLEAMNELEREMYLFEREEQLQRERQRRAVQQQMQQRRDAEQTEVRASSRRPRAATGAEGAIGRIAAAHAQREAREKKKQREAEQRQEQQRARGRRKVATEDEEEAEEAEPEQEAEEPQEPEAADESDELAGLAAEDDDELGEGAAVRAEEYDEGTGYEELEEMASLEEVRSIQLKRSDLEAWHNEPFFEEDVRHCVVRIVANMGPGAPAGPPPYMLVRIADVVTRNSYAFGKPGARTRKWLHLDDLSGRGVFRHQMAQVSNSEVTEVEYEKARARAARGNARFITKGDVQTAQAQLQHARTFKYDSKLVKAMLEKKRAAGKLAGSATLVRAQLEHNLRLAQQEGRPEEEIQRLRDELERVNAQEAARQGELDGLMTAALTDADRQASLAAKQPGLALSIVNARNREKNAFKLINAPAGSAAAKSAAGGDPNVPNLFARRHTQSKVYWATGRGNANAASQQQEAQAAPQLQRTASGAADVSQLKGSLKQLEPSELIKVLDLQLDLSRLPRRSTPAALLPKRLLGLRWYESVQKRQQGMAGRSLLTLDDWKHKMTFQLQMQGGQEQ